jgi:putative phosphoesterase
LRVDVRLKIGVISDTHARFFPELPQKLVSVLSKVDLIIHAGDIVTLDVIRGLEILAPVTGVYGNMDYPEVKCELSQQRVLELAGKKIGVVHGSGGPHEIEERVLQLFPGVDAIVFGHSHVALNKLHGGILLFNPGSARESYGILDVGEKIEGKIYRGYF